MFFFPVLDSSGRAPVGLFQGTLADLGAFDSCVETVLTSDEGEETLRGQYCNVYVKSPHGDYVKHVRNITALSHRRVSPTKVRKCTVGLRRALSNVIGHTTKLKYYFEDLIHFLVIT